MNDYKERYLIAVFVRGKNKSIEKKVFVKEYNKKVFEKRILSDICKEFNIPDKKVNDSDNELGWKYFRKLEDNNE